jgi:hypothetical protein
MASVQDLLGALWKDYVAMNPQAGQIHRLLQARGERVVNDHIALRTYDDPRLNLDVLAERFTRYGYAASGEYVFVEKKLAARHYEHPDASLPKVFISELKVGEFPPKLGEIVRRLVSQVPEAFLQRWDLPAAGRPWDVSYEEYEALRAHSEYAAWVAAFGFRANHFTVFVNELRTCATLEELNALLKQNGFRLNSAGGEIKGSPEVMLEQSSTLADQVDVQFSDGRHVIPGCYYEFARRYPMPDGTLYQGFVEKSADRIFESTNRR